MSKVIETTLKFHFDSVKKWYDNLINQENIVELNLTCKSLMVEEEGRCGSTLISYNFLNKDLSGMIGYMNRETLEDFLHLTKIIEIATIGHKITVSELNKYIKE